VSRLRASANLLTIPAGVDFLAVLAAALLDGGLGLPAPARDDPFALADTVIYVPTRRAAQG
jgi:ATP-dependent helicase/nuclease subunit B